MEPKKIFLASIQGFCSGVATAIEIVERALKKYGTPLYVYHDIVHNTFVVKQFKERGVIFVERISDVPVGGHIIFSAHGISPEIIKEARQRSLQFIDATCPLVKKVHQEAVRFSNEGRQVILIGHKGHQEIIGTAAYVDPRLLHFVQHKQDVETLKIDADAAVAFVTQTTLSIDEANEIIDLLKKKFKNIVGPAKEDICYATQNRQDAVKELAMYSDVILICGSANSSNSNRLRETGERAGVPSYIIDHADELDSSWLDNKKIIGVSSGASVPCNIVDELIARIQELFPGTTVELIGEASEPTTFPLPEI